MLDFGSCSRSIYRYVQYRVIYSAQSQRLLYPHPCCRVRRSHCAFWRHHNRLIYSNKRRGTEQGFELMTVAIVWRVKMEPWSPLASLLPQCLLHFVTGLWISTVAYLCSLVQLVVECGLLRHHEWSGRGQRQCARHPRLCRRPQLIVQPPHHLQATTMRCDHMISITVSHKHDCLKYATVFHQ